MLAGECI